MHTQSKQNNWFATFYAKLVLMLGILSLSFAASAMSLDQAKAQGLVGETSSGYLALVKQDAQAQEIVERVNQKRKQHYQKLAKKNGIQLSQVEALAASKAIEKTQSGHFIQVNGRWLKK